MFNVDRMSIHFTRRDPSRATAVHVDREGIFFSVERMLKYFVQLHSPQLESFDQFYRNGPKRLVKSQSTPMRFTFYDVFCDMTTTTTDDTLPPAPPPARVEEPPVIMASPSPVSCSSFRRISSIFCCRRASVRNRRGIAQLVIRFNDQRTSQLWTHPNRELKKSSRMRRVQTWQNSYDLRPLDQCLEY